MTQLLDKFRELPDYRKCKQLKFNVGEIMFMSLLATLSGANGYIENLKKENYKSSWDMHL